jgi:hypothetical protein
MTSIWQWFFKQAKCTPESIAEIERKIQQDINHFDRYA